MAPLSKSWIAESPNAGQRDLAEDRQVRTIIRSPADSDLAYNSVVTSKDQKPLLAILDGHGIIHRAYYALKDKPLVARRTGENTSGVFGFTNTLLSVIDDLKPTHIAVAMDLPGPTFRHVRDASYKATRFEGLKTQVVRSLRDVPELDEKVRQEIADIVAGAENREQIKTGLMETAESGEVAAEAMERD